MKEATKKVILKIKEVKQLKGLSNQDILDLCESKGDSVSSSTVRRMMAKGSEDGPDFRQYSVNAVFRAVVGTDDIHLTAEEEADLSDVEKETIAENAALKAVIELRDTMIANLEEQIKKQNREISELQKELHDTATKLESTINVIRIAAESFGKGSL